MCDIAARAGGMDFQKVQEQWKWQAMIRKERKIELNNFKAHMDRFARQKSKQSGSADANRPANKKSDDESTIKFPAQGLGQLPPKVVPAMEPKKFVVSQHLSYLFPNLSHTL